jgi:hypothetical protein
VLVFHAGSHLLWENRTTAAPNRVLARPLNGLFADNLTGPGGVRNLNDWEKC